MVDGRVDRGAVELDRRVEEREPLVVLDDLGQHLLRRGCGEAVVDGRPELGEGREALVERERGGAEAKLPVAVDRVVDRVVEGGVPRGDVGAERAQGLVRLARRDDGRHVGGVEVDVS